MSAVITLTTDFGLSDAYVAAMKGVILGINPAAALVDISHNIRPRNVAGAAFVLSTAYSFFPERTIHVVVVDPGVGTERNIVLLRTPAFDFLAPDNGVLGYVVRPYATGPVKNGRQALKSDAGVAAFAVTEPRFWRQPVSATFHGRDIFAPVAAHLSLGVSPSDFGPHLDSLAVLPLSCPSRAPDGSLLGHVLHVDGFGNLITDVTTAELPPDTSAVTVELHNRVIRGLSLTYGSGEGLLALIGSGGYLEISLKDGSAAAFLHARAGDEVRIS